MGNDASMLDILHVSDSAIVRSAGARDGRGRFLAGGTRGENDLGEIRLLEESTSIG